MAISLRGLHPAVRPAAQWTLDVAAHYNVPVTVTSTLRTWNEQRALRARYEKCLREGRFPGPGPCRFPANRPGDSSHNYGLSFDSTVPDHLMDWWAHVRRLAGFHVPVNDKIHAEVPNWRQYVS